MKAWFGALALLAAVSIALEYALANWLQLSMLSAVAFAPVTTKLALRLLQISALAAVALGGLHLVIGRRSGMGPLLAVISWASPLIGALASTLAGMTIAAALAHSHTHNIRVIGPSVVQALMPLAVGLFVGAIAAGAAAFARGPRPAGSA